MSWWSRRLIPPTTRPPRDPDNRGVTRPALEARCPLIETERGSQTLPRACLLDAVAVGRCSHAGEHLVIHATFAGYVGGCPRGPSGGHRTHSPVVYRLPVARPVVGLVGSGYIQHAFAVRRNYGNLIGFATVTDRRRDRRGVVGCVQQQC